MAAIKDKSLSVVLSDLHIPFQDPYVCRMALAFIRDNRPGAVHLLGDICDFYTLSRFDKDPMRKDDLQSDLDNTKRWLASLRDAAGDSKILYSGGNHEFRLQKYLRSEARALAGLRSLSLSEMLSLDKLDIQFRDHDAPYRFGSLLFTHGSLIRKWSAATARAHYEKYGCSVIHGHSHRLGSFYHRDIGDTFGAWENGCLCDLNPDYVATPDWQQGWSTVWTKKNYFHVEQTAVVKGRYMYHGQTYGRRRLSSQAHYEVENLALAV